MHLVDVYSEPRAISVLYEIMAERPPESWISHEAMPTLEAHKLFVAMRPFRLWLLIQVQAAFVGAIEATDRNELGISILKRFQRHGYGRTALTMFLRDYPPLPPIPAIGNGKWLANIAVNNVASAEFFGEMGFVPLQETWVRRDD